MPVIIELPTPAGDTLTVLRDEVLARGFDYLEDTPARVDRAINTAINRVCQQDAWPFLQAVGSGPDQLEIGNLYGWPEEVRWRASATSSSITLQRRTRAELAVAGADLTREGTPHAYYLDDGDTVIPYPLGSGTIEVVWRHRPDPLEDDADVCIVPQDYSDVVIDCAVRELEKDRHNWTAVQALEDVFLTRVAEMRDSLLEQQAVVLPDGDA